MFFFKKNQGLLYRPNFCYIGKVDPEKNNVYNTTTKKVVNKYIKSVKKKKNQREEDLKSKV